MEVGEEENTFIVVWSKSMENRYCKMSVQCTVYSVQSNPITFIMMVLDISLSWEPEKDGNVTGKSEKYLPTSNDPRMVTSSNITVKVMK